MLKYAIVKNTEDLNKVLSSQNDRYEIFIPIDNRSANSNNLVECVKLLTCNSNILKDKISIITIESKTERPDKHVLNCLKILYDLNKKLNNSIKCEIEVCHTLYGTSNEKILNWDIETILKADRCIENVCNFIKKMNFSPLEALAYLHRYVSTVAKYKKSENSLNDWSSHDQFFAGAYMQSPEIVCMGYASLMKEIIDNLKIPGLECDLAYIELKISQNAETAEHARCFLKINDRKYGVNQSVLDDATWDNMKTEPDLGSLDKSLFSGEQIKTYFSKYSHFAMQNDCLSSTNNGLYHFYDAKYVDIIGGDKLKTDNTISHNMYNFSKNKIDQFMIETIQFSIIQKEYPEKSADEIYQILSSMAELSFDEQQKRKFNGVLKQKEPILSSTQAKQLFDINNNNKNKIDDEKSIFDFVC